MRGKVFQRFSPLLQVNYKIISFSGISVNYRRLKYFVSTIIEGKRWWKLENVTFDKIEMSLILFEKLICEIFGKVLLSRISEPLSLEQKTLEKFRKLFCIEIFFENMETFRNFHFLNLNQSKRRKAEKCERNEKNIIQSCNKFHLRFSLHDNLKYLWCLRNFYIRMYFVSRKTTMPGKMPKNRKKKCFRSLNVNCFSFSQQTNKSFKGGTKNKWKKNQCLGERRNFIFPEFWLKDGESNQLGLTDR